MFKIRKTKPEKGNKCYICTSSGGWNTCVKGKPTDANCDALANCVGYAQGRFNEIYNEIKGTTGNKYNTLNCNAENFIERAQKVGLQIVDYPTLGGIMVFQKGTTLSGSDGAGHVWINEDLLAWSGNKPSKIYTSESAWNGSVFYNSIRTNNNGRWGMGSAYKFRGCIVNPAIGITKPPVEPTPTPQPNLAPTPSVSTSVKYTVQKGDNLSKIAKKYGTTWNKIYKDNKALIDNQAKKHGVKAKFENYLYPGQVLTINKD